ncbi:hypothetical protein TZ53_15100 [Sphingobium sp. YBL2]|nr:hypothetical protein TZ53_15100 [Sphingobium sp. YBL2]
MKAQPFQCSIPVLIAGGPMAARMDFAVDFDSQSCRQTGKVETVAVYRMLAPEFETAGACLQGAPQDDFR